MFVASVLNLEVNGFPTNVYPLAAGFNVTTTSEDGSAPAASSVTGNFDELTLVLS